MTNIDNAAFVKELEAQFGVQISQVSEQNYNATAKVNAAAQDIHPSIMINRIGVYYGSSFKKEPQTLIEQCAYFRVCGRLPHQKIGGDVYASMRQNALDWYYAMNNEERNELQKLYYGLPEDWRN